MLFELKKKIISKAIVLKLKVLDVLSLYHAVH